MLDSHCRSCSELCGRCLSHPYRTGLWFVDRREADVVDKLSSSLLAASRHLFGHSNATAMSFLHLRDNKGSRKGRNNSDLHCGRGGKRKYAAMELQG
jgi:hypothetical protein